MNEAINASRLNRKRRHTSLALSGLRTFLAEATGYAPGGGGHISVAADPEGGSSTALALSGRRSSHTSSLPTHTPDAPGALRGAVPLNSGGTYRPMSLATSAVLFALGLATGLAVSFVRGGRRA